MRISEAFRAVAAAVEATPVPAGTKSWSRSSDDETRGDRVFMLAPTNRIGPRDSGLDPWTRYELTLTLGLQPGGFDDFDDYERLLTETAAVLRHLETLGDPTPFVLTTSYITDGPIHVAAVTIEVDMTESI